MKTMSLTGETPPKRGFTGRRGDPMTAPRCGAKTRKGTPCRRAAKLHPHSGRRTRCRLHGGVPAGGSVDRRDLLARGMTTSALQLYKRG
jgi:hypothetical protein